MALPGRRLMSSDGLVLAKLSHEPGGAHVMELQAQGLVGLSAYANRAARVRFGASLASTACSTATAGSIWCSRMRRSATPICRLSNSSCWTARCDRSRVRAAGRRERRICAGVRGDRRRFRARSASRPAAAANLRAFRLRPLRHRPDRARGGRPASSTRAAPSYGSAGATAASIPGICAYPICRSAASPTRTPARRGSAWRWRRSARRSAAIPASSSRPAKSCCPAGPARRSVAVGPVDGLRGKLMLVGDYIVQHRKALAGARMTVVLPATTPDGRSLAAAEASTLERLKSRGDRRRRGARFRLRRHARRRRRGARPFRDARDRHAGARDRPRRRDFGDRASCRRMARADPCADRARLGAGADRRGQTRAFASIPTTPRRSAPATIRRPTSCNCWAIVSTSSASRWSSAARRC
jgi:hypothetical protein